MGLDRPSGSISLSLSDNEQTTDPQLIVMRPPMSAIPLVLR